MDMVPPIPPGIHHRERVLRNLTKEEVMQLCVAVPFFVKFQLVNVHKITLTEYELYHLNIRLWENLMDLVPHGAWRVTLAHELGLCKELLEKMDIE